MKWTILLFLMFAGAGLQAADSTFYLQTTDGVRLYVNVSGAGRPCIFVHGGPGSSAGYFQAFQEGGPIEEKVRMVYYDQRGSGRSSSPANGDYSVSRMEKDLEEIRLHLGYEKWAVMGHSFGGIIMTHYAQRFPERVAAMLYIHCTLDIQCSMMSQIRFGLQQLGLDSASFLTDGRPLIQQVGTIHNKLGEKGIWYKIMYRNAYEKAINDSVYHLIPSPNRDFADAVWSIPEYAASCVPLTKGIRCPVLVMAGKQDYAIGTRHYRDFQFPDQTVILYQGGHAPFQEEPQWFAEKLCSFFEKIRY